MSDHHIPDGPIESSPTDYMPNADQRALVRETLTNAGVELGSWDERMVEWVGGWDWTVVAVIVSWLRRASQGGDRP
ncbi:hypothetical protein [Streptomyces axinellae]|uniref:Uncharacterized protein n=1 Tax=Streptomyces axinellae TaxID=552788 RepID=A0ABN3QMI0_9ACTN